MPLLQGQPFKLVSSPDLYPEDSVLYTIQHTGEKFLNKSDYEDRLALYSQGIWTCQGTGRPGLTHQEAWMSETKVRLAAQEAIPHSLQRSVLTLVHHSLSPLEQLIDASSILCHSQFHIGENLLLAHPKETEVKVVKSKDIPKFNAETPIANGLTCENKNFINNGTANGGVSEDSPGSSPGKENETKVYQFQKDDSGCKKEMLPKLYDVVTLEDQKLIENVPSKHLLRSYRIPSKDQLRLFIRSCALRHRGSTCTPWVVADDLVKKFNISNKLPSLFISSHKTHLPLPKRKSQSPISDPAKRVKPDIHNVTNNISSSKLKTCSPSEPVNNRKNSPSLSSQKCVKTGSQLPMNSLLKRPFPLGRPKNISRPLNFKKPSNAKKSLPASKGTDGTPRKRGRPPLSAEEKERNKKLRQATLMDLTSKIGTQFDGKLNVLKVKGSLNQLPSQLIPPTIPSPAYSSSVPLTHPLSSSAYKSPVKRATTPESIMKLPFMRRFVHEHKTIKGVLGQFRRYAHTMDMVLAKLSSAQIELIPEESLKQDLLTRHKKVQDKKFYEKLTPEERKQHIRDRARFVALERWKERKLRNLKVEDNLVSGLLPLPDPNLVETTKDIPNSLFGDVVMITDYIKCFQELLLGEETFKITTNHLMESISSRSEGYRVIADIMCCILPTIVHDHISKNCKEIGIKISVIPINYQTAPELARLCLRKQDEEELTISNGEETEQIGKEKTELSEELLTKLETCEFWELTPPEIIFVLKALVHKSLCTAAISIYVEEVDEKVLQALRERRKFLKQMQKVHKAESDKRKEERIQNKMFKNVEPKRQRGRPKGYSPKFGYLNSKPEAKPEPKPSVDSISQGVQKRRISAEISRKEKEESMKVEKERQKQLNESNKRLAVDKKYDDIAFKRDNLLRRIPVGFDRNHNRYWIFHSTTPGLYVEKGWVDDTTDYKYSLYMSASTTENSSSVATPEETSAPSTPVKTEATSINNDYNKKSSSQHITRPKSENTEEPKINNEERQEMSENEIKVETVKEEVKEEIKNEQTEEVKETKQKSDADNDDNQSLSQVKSKLSISPMKMNYRGRPPKEAYVLVDEDTQTFPVIEENKWHYYRNMDEVKSLMNGLSDQGQRESQLVAALNINKDRLHYHYNKKTEPLKFSSISSNRLKESLKEDIVQIEKELIEGWLGGVPDFDEWEQRASMADDVSTLGALLIEAQESMQMKNLKGIMAPIKEVNVTDTTETNTTTTVTEYHDTENPGVGRWKEAVRSCQTYSRLHVLVGLFDSCIRWEKSMATRKCKVCRNKGKEDPLVMCEKCETSYHWYCLRPPLKEDPGESWCCPACMPKKTRREEVSVEQEPIEIDKEEMGDPTFSLSSYKRKSKKRTKLADFKRQDKECIVCSGRVGLIICSRCSTGFHSECHNPPLLSRARKDWVCGDCLNPEKSRFTKDFTEDGEGKPTTRRNIFGDMEDTGMLKRVGNLKGPRDSSGRFLPIPAIEKNSTEEADDDSIEVGGSTRSHRGAKAKALNNIKLKGNVDDSRRSTRNRNRKNYKDESEEEDEEEEGEEEASSNESDSNEAGDNESDDNNNNNSSDCEIDVADETNESKANGDSGSEDENEEESEIDDDDRNAEEDEDNGDADDDDDDDDGNQSDVSDSGDGQGQSESDED